MRFQLLLAESLRSVRASLSTTFAATMTVLIGMFLLGLSIALGTWVVSWSDHVKKDVRVKVFYCTDHTCSAAHQDGDVNKIGDWLGKDPRVKSYSYISKEQALKIMEKRSPELVQDLS
jgi:cell division protein FtsX